MKFTICSILYIICVIFVSLDSHAQPELIGEGALISSLEGPKNIPICKGVDTVSVVLVEYYSPYYYHAVEYVRYPQGGWELDFIIPSSTSFELEYYADGTGGHYFYDCYDNVLIYRIEYLDWVVRDCPGRPVFDSENNIHIIWEDHNNNLFYGISSDTLGTFDVIDTLEMGYDFGRLITSPDNGLVGALFIDSNTDSLYKYICDSGDALDFSTPTGVLPHQYSDVRGLYDITIDYEGNLYYVTKLSGGGHGWGREHVWSEQHGFRYLMDGDDDAMMGTSYEITFGPEDGEIMLIRSERMYQYSDSYFLVSFDYGDIWYLSSFSLFSLHCADGSALRHYLDSIDFVYFTGIPDPFQSFYYPIPRDSILYELTSTSDVNSAVPFRISLSNYPNPFNSSTTISFSLREEGHAKLEIYDIQGRLVKTLIDGGMSAGASYVSWDGTDSGGRVVASGIYF
ncbi:MAG: FlgD immunoglobulin-like domain containing protein, partial [Planctomycetota bacterium]